ncbi:MAG: hypothetical protein U0798_00245 [Gemmataceae bacterium]
MAFRPNPAVKLLFNAVMDEELKFSDVEAPLMGARPEVQFVAFPQFESVGLLFHV